MLTFCSFDLKKSKFIFTFQTEIDNCLVNIGLMGMVEEEVGVMEDGDLPSLTNTSPTMVTNILPKLHMGSYL